jgi:glyoxylase-like metal-dependent hydrolase (beta-lactamase superfamily II)
MEQITENVFTITGLSVGRVYVIKGGDGLTIVDASLRGAEKTIAKNFAEAGWSLKDVRHILITHAHPDHIGGLAALAEASGAQVYAHALEAPIIRGESPIARPKPEALDGVAALLARLIPTPKLTSFVVHHELREGDALPIEGWQVVEFPGHTYGQIGFYEPNQRLVICGDTLMHFNGLRLPISFFTVDMAEAKRSIKKLAAMPLEIVCFGHGKPMRGEQIGKIHAFAAKL